MLRALLLAAGGAAASFAQRRLAAPPPPLARLTPRQRQVLAGLARGKLRKQIARELGISEATVKTHIANACRRLGVATRAEAVARLAALSARERPR